jgi:hypothetical protein
MVTSYRMRLKDILKYVIESNPDADEKTLREKFDWALSNPCRYFTNQGMLNNELRELAFDFLYPDCVKVVKLTEGVRR